MKILVVGGSGQLGRNVVSELKQRNHECISCDIAGDIDFVLDATNLEETKNNYMSANGLETQSLEEIRQDLTNQFNNIYGVEVNLDQNSPDAQWINILAQEKKDTLDLITQIYNNVDVDAVIGLPQQVLYKLNGLTIKAFTYSYCYVNVTVSKSITLQGLDDNMED